MKMKCWGNMMSRMRLVLKKVSRKIGLRKSAGLVKLQQDVSTCEYEDVHVLWEMLKRNNTDLSRSRKGPFWEFVQWTKHTPLICRAG